MQASKMLEGKGLGSDAAMNGAMSARLSVYQRQNSNLGWNERQVGSPAGSFETGRCCGFDDAAVKGCDSRMALGELAQDLEAILPVRNG